MDCKSTFDFSFEQNHLKDRESLSISIRLVFYILRRQLVTKVITMCPVTDPSYDTKRL